MTALVRFRLDEEPLSTLAEARRLSGALAARAEFHDREGRFSFEGVGLLQGARLWSLGVPGALGGRDVGLPEAVEVIREIGRGDPSTALVLLMQTLHHRAVGRSRTWPATVREQVGRAAVQEGALLNALRNERALGSPVRGGLPATRARRVAGGWRLSGRKIFSTGAPALRWGIVWAATDEPAPRVGEFLVPISAPGVSIEPTWDHLGLRASGSDDVVFEDVFLPDDHAVDIRRPEAWTELDAEFGAWLSLMLAALYDGVAHAARDWLLDWLRERRPSSLGASLATVPRIQHAVGEIEAWLMTNAGLLETTSRAIGSDPASPATVKAALVKYVVTGNAVSVVERALSLTGNHGLSRANPLERHYRNVLCSRVHQPQDDIILEGAGRRALAP